MSATLYKTYRQCPASAGGRLDGHYPPETVHSFKGALTHRLIRRRLEGGPIDDLAQACREEIGQGLNNKLVAIGVNSPSKLRPLIEEASELLRRFEAVPVDGFRFAEVSLDVPASEGVRLVGRIDAVFDHEGGIKLVDWKTGELGEPFDQLGFYALAWAMDRDEIPALVEALSVATGESRQAVFTGSDLTEIAAEISALVTALRTSWADRGKLELTGGPWCRFCALLDGCSEGRSAVKLLARASE